MTIFRRRMGLCLLILAVSLFLVVPSAFASDTTTDEATLIFNGQVFEADLYLEGGLSYISTESLNKIPGVNEEQEGYLALREYFETRDGIVDWDGDKWEISVSWREKAGEWTADDLTIHSSSLLLEKNTYKMKGDLAMKMSVTGLDLGDIPEMQEIPEMTYKLEGVFQQDPLAMYMKQTVALPVEVTDLAEAEEELSDEEIALLTGGDLTTEIVWLDDSIYQKTFLSDQWIVQDLSELDIMNELTNMMNSAPQQTLELMREFGIINVFGDDVTFDGQDYYTVQSYVDSKTFQKMLDEMLGDFDFAELMAESMQLSVPDEAIDETDQDMAEEIAEVFNQIMSSMEVEYYIDSYVNKETLLTDRMQLDMNLNFSIDLSQMDIDDAPEGTMGLDMGMTGELYLYDYGTELELPDVSNAITQAEFIEQLMKAAEEMEALEALENNEVVPDADAIE